jgi:hypothetical protein
MTKAAEILAKTSMDEVCAQIIEGRSYREIAGDLGIGTMTLCDWLNRDEESRVQSARARSLSAEAWLDKGLDVVASALSKSGDVDASAARAYAQECARRAAVRNPQYREKIDNTHAAPDGSPIKHTVTLDFGKS